jgi:hypothetical protein
MARNAVRLSAVTLGLLAAACAPRQWTHPQQGQAHLAQDLSDCNKMAEIRTYRFAERDSFAGGPESFRGIEYRPTFESPSDHRSDQVLAQAETRKWCMRDKGYVMAPVEKTQAGQ